MCKKIYNVNPVFFILKKLDKSSKKYSFNFPIYNHSISLGFSKEQFKKTTTYTMNTTRITKHSR